MTKRGRGWIRRDLRSRLAVPDYEATIERAFILGVEAFDWNCPQHITPRYALEELKALRFQDEVEKEQP